jgi:hypothetical protein
VEIFLAAIIVAVAIVVSGGRIVTGLKAAAGEERRRARQLSIAALFAPALSQVQDDPKALLAWQPLAKTLRVQFPQEFAALDTAAGSTFPFSTDLFASAHAKWTTEWLAWERTHDATYKLNALQAQKALEGDADSAVARATLEAIEREKLDLYQRRYEVYVRVGKALQALRD